MQPDGSMTTLVRLNSHAGRELSSRRPGLMEVWPSGPRKLPDTHIASRDPILKRDLALRVLP